MEYDALRTPTPPVAPGQPSGGADDEEAQCPFVEEKKRTRELSDALECVSIEDDTEAQDAPSSLGSMWGLLASPNKEYAPQGESVAKEPVARVIKEGLWIPHWESYERSQTLRHKLEAECRILDIYNEDQCNSDP